MPGKNISMINSSISEEPNFNGLARNSTSKPSQPSPCGYLQKWSLLLPSVCLCIQGANWLLLLPLLLWAYSPIFSFTFSSCPIVSPSSSNLPMQSEESKTSSSQNKSTCLASLIVDMKSVRIRNQLWWKMETSTGTNQPNLLKGSSLTLPVIWEILISG